MISTAAAVESPFYVRRGGAAVELENLKVIHPIQGVERRVHLRMRGHFDNGGAGQRGTNGRTGRLRGLLCRRAPDGRRGARTSGDGRRGFRIGGRSLRG